MVDRRCSVGRQMCVCFHDISRFCPCSDNIQYSVWWKYHEVVPKVVPYIFRQHDSAGKELTVTLRWRHNELDGVSDHQPHDCLLNHLFGCRSKKTSKLRVTGLCAGIRREFPAQMASDAENISIWWRHHGSIHSAVTHFTTLTNILLTSM